jgi:ribose transport system ATP-binding protein
MPHRLQLIDIQKRFAGVHALKGVSFSLDAGEIVALIGENGAGKSTLMNILGGVIRADSGRILLDDRQINIQRVADAASLGIGFVHQEPNILDNLDVVGNLFLGCEPTRFGLIDRHKMAELASPILHRLGLNIDPLTPMDSLSPAQHQLVEIAKALLKKARILILDEPTSSLTASETERLFAILRELRDEGAGIIFISHRLMEIRQLADRVVALRDGQNAGELAREQITHENMVQLMIGRELRGFFVAGNGAGQSCRLRLCNIRTPAWPNQAVSLDANSGQILTLAGLVGAGRTELAQAIFGIHPKISGEILLDGQPLNPRSPGDAISAGIYLAPEDRRRFGLISNMSVGRNVTLPSVNRFARFGWIDRSAEFAAAEKQVRALQIKTPNLNTITENLSGGTQQKVVLAKWLAMNPKVLIVDEPTRGIDVGAKAEIYRLLRELASQGVCVIVISSDLEEVLGISDTIAVMREGAIAGRLERPQFTERAVMNLAFGRGNN